MQRKPKSRSSHFLHVNWLVKRFSVRTLFLVLSTMMALAAPVLADDDSDAGSATPSLIISQPKPYTRANEYFLPNPNMSTLSGNPYYGGLGGGLGGIGLGTGLPVGLVGGMGGPWLGGGAPVYATPYASPLGLGAGYGGLAPNFGYGGLGGGGFNRGYGGWGNYGGSGIAGIWGGSNSYGGWGGHNAWNGGYGGGYGGWGRNGGYGSYGGSYGVPGLGFGGMGFGGFGGGWGGNGGLGEITPSHVVQTEPSKASGNYYAPSTVDTTASGSYYAQTDATQIQMPVKRQSTNSNYFKPDSSSNYWGAGGGSSTPLGKDLNSVPWNK